MNRDLFLAILAMDAYNRGNAPGIVGLSDAVGTRMANTFALRRVEYTFARAQ
jgi:hypothetical protein